MSIVLTDLSKHFDEHLVVNHVSLDVNEGELFVLLGSSGSGKSTILRLIAGLTLPDAGRIELNGRDVTRVPPQVRNTGFVFQNYSIFRHMTVYENVEFGLRIRHVRPAERRQRADELLDLIGLAGLGGRYASQLSGGQQQRVALARALAYQPAVLLLDEPFGALDVQIRAQLRQSLITVQRRLKVTTILVTHDQEEAFELADRIGVINAGNLIEVGQPDELYHRPRTEFTATFIGGANVLVGRKSRDEIQLGTAVLPLPAGVVAMDDGTPARVLFRPETILVQAEPFSEDSGIQVLGQGEVVECVFLGALQRLVLAVEGLRGVRPLTPRLAYGQQAAHIEVTRPSDDPDSDSYELGQKLWLGLRHYHIIPPIGLKALICVDIEADSGTVIDFGCRLTCATRGPATLLTVTRRPDTIPGIREKLGTARSRWLAAVPQLETRVRQGDTAEEILLEAQEGHYELVIVGHRAAAGTVSPGFSAVVWQVLEQAELPVLLVSTPRPTIERILICTRAGEPGKTDVTFGGRLAHRTGAEAFVLHVKNPHATAEEQARVDRHLRQAQAALAVLGLQSLVTVADGPIVQRIVEQAEVHNVDLIVIGAPASRSPRRLLWRNLASQIVGGATRPVLIVPMQE